MSTGKEKVVFYFPWKELSRGPFYLTKLADDLADKENYEVYYVDYKNGLSDSMLKNSKVDKIEYNEYDFGFPFNEPITIITPIYWAHKIPSTHKDSKIVFLNWHYCCIPTLKHDSKWPKILMKSFLKLVQKTNSCFFLDYSHLLGQNTKKIKFKENYVPIKLQEKEQRAISDLVCKNEINFGVVGRLDGDKVYSILNLLDNLSNLNLEKQANLYIIGDGKHRKLFEKKCDKANYRSKNINIIMYGKVVGKELNDFLANKVDALFAMGTSIIEGAAIALPCVIVPSNTKSFVDNKYVYFHNSIKYCLGWFNTQIPQLGLETIQLKEIIDDIYNKNKKVELGKKAYEYYYKNHKENIDKFIFAMNDSTLKYGQLLNHIKLYYTINSFFSIRKNRKIKTITILNFKFRLKRKIKKKKNF